MDFHTLSRRDLQALCKRNKIPANITNLAMADSLQSLPTVEGLEELLTRSVTDYPETPAKSMTATPSATRTSKLTTRTRQVKNDVPKAAPPSACAKPSIARSTHGNVENSAATHAYTTRRSTRLLEKQMDQLSLKDNEDVVDSNANLGKDSQDMQRQFSEDMDNSLALDESNVTNEAVEEPVYAVVPLQNMDVLLENEQKISVGSKTDEPVNMDAALDLEKECIQVEESTNDKECKNDEDEPMQEDVAEQMDIVSLPNLNGAEEEVSHPITSATENAVVADISITAVQTDETQMVVDEATQEEVVIVKGEETLGSEAVDNSAVPAVDDAKKVDPQIKLEKNADKEEETAFQAQEFSDGEFDFLSESDEDSDINEEVDQLVENDNPESVCQNDDMVDGFSNTEIAEPAASRSPLMPPREQFASKSSDGQVLPISDNKENFQMKPVFALQNASSAAKTPLEKKSLRQLKKMVKLLAADKKQQAGEKQPAPLHLRAENL